MSKCDILTSLLTEYPSVPHSKLFLIVPHLIVPNLLTILGSRLEVESCRLCWAQSTPKANSVKRQAEWLTAKEAIKITKSSTNEISGTRTFGMTWTQTISYSLTPFSI